MRWDSVLTGLTALRSQSEPKSCTTLHRAVPNRRARPLGNCCPVPQAIACSFILARQITCRNKIPTVGVLWCPVLITTLNKANGSKLTAVSHKPCGSSDGYPFTIQTRSARAAKCQEGHCTQSPKGGFASKVAKLWQAIHFAGHFSRRIIAWKSPTGLDLHPAGLEPATL